MQIEMWPVARVIPFERNARKIPERAVEKVAASIKQFGWRQPIVVDEAGVIIIGHVRRLAALFLKEEEVPVHVATGLSAEQVRLLRLADNRVHDESSWDEKLLAVELADLSQLCGDISGAGFNVRELVQYAKPLGREGEDDVPTPPVAPVAQPGELWRLGPHRIICGDCTDAPTVARLLAGEQPLLMVTDPPYGISLDSAWRDRAGLGSGKPRTAGHGETAITGDERAEWSAAFALVPSLQVAYVWHASRFTREVLTGLERIGFLYPQQIIWNKGRAVLTRTHYWFQHEPCWYVRKVNAPWYGKPGECVTIWDAPSPKFIRGSSTEEAFDHPTQKPVELMRKSIVHHTVEGQIVYEPFSGSGTTIAAAEVTGRTCYACELDPKYVDVAIARWQNLSGAEATLDGDGRTFAEISEQRRTVVAA